MSVFKCLTWTTRLDKILDEVQPGDLVCFHRGLFIHHAVYVGRGRAVHHHLGPNDGEVIEATMEYLAKGDLMKVFAVTGTPFSREEIVYRARSQIGPLPYSLHGGNCEHFTTWVYHGVRQSKQLNSLGQYQLRLLQVVKHSSNTEVAVQQQQKQALARCSTEAMSSFGESKVEDDLNAGKTDGNKNDAEDLDDGFAFAPPRPVKYRAAKNSAQLALNHTRSCLKVLTVQAVVHLAAVPLHKCGLQADNLRRIGRRISAKRKSRRATSSGANGANEAAPQATNSSSGSSGSDNRSPGVATENTAVGNL